MTIGVAVKAPECLVLASDSRGTIVKDFVGIVNFSDLAVKIMQISDYPVGVFHWGLSSLSQRSVTDIVSDFSGNLPSLQSSPTLQIDVASLATALFDFVRPEYDKYTDQRHQKDSGIVIGGYATNAHFPELYLLELMKDWPGEAASLPVLLFPDGGNNAKQFGVQAFGQTSPLNRLLNGVDENLLEKWEQWWNQRTGDVYDPDQIEKASGFPKQHIQLFLRQFGYELSCSQMHVQDAIDCATYLVNVVIGLNRFWLYAPTCGGDIDVAVIRRTGFQWLKRRS